MRHGKIVILPLLILSIALACGRKQEGIRWANSLDNALARAKESNQHVLVEFYTQTCKWCHALAETTFADSGVVAFSREFIWAKVDARADTQAARDFSILAYPTVLLLEPSGQEVDRIVGYLRPEPFVTQVKDYLVGKGTFARLREQVQEDSTDAELLYQLGEKYHQRGFWDQSLSLFKKVIRLDPENEGGLSDDALYYQGEALQRLERTDEAVARFQQLMDRYPESELVEDAQLEIGYTYQKAERNHEAVAVYQGFLLHHPGHQYEEWIKKQLEKLAENP